MTATERDEMTKVVTFLADHEWALASDAINNALLCERGGREWPEWARNLFIAARHHSDTGQQIRDTFQRFISECLETETVT